jgi:hypothetical protein
VELEPVFEEAPSRHHPYPFPGDIYQDPDDHGQGTGDPESVTPCSGGLQGCMPFMEEPLLQWEPVIGVPNIDQGEKHQEYDY